MEPDYFCRNEIFGNQDRTPVDFPRWRQGVEHMYVR